MPGILRTLLTMSILGLISAFTVTSPAEAATLKVSSFPSGAQVSVDGVNTGKVTPMGISVVEGNHSVTVSMPGSGWIADTRVVTIVAGNNDLSVTLMPAVDRADGPCFDHLNRYVDCGNGTVTDTVTGLIWLKNLDCLERVDWVAAKNAVAGLRSGVCGLSDGSSPGEWRLPSKDEWTATIAQAVALGCTFAARPSLTNDSGTACYGDGSHSSFAGLANLDLFDSFFWSGSSFEGDPRAAYNADLLRGRAHFVHPLVSMSFKEATGHFRAWPVRAESR